MDVADAAAFVDDAHQGHAPKFKEVDFLAILDRDTMFGIGQADAGNFFVHPILPEGGFGVRTDGDDLCAALLEFLIFIADARQRRAAIGSGEAAQEIQHERLFAAKIGETDEVAVQIFDFKFGGECAGSEERGFHGDRGKAIQRFSKSAIQRINEARKARVASAICVHCSSAEIVAGLSPS